MTSDTNVNSIRCRETFINSNSHTTKDRKMVVVRRSEMASTLEWWCFCCTGYLTSYTNAFHFCKTNLAVVGTSPNLFMALRTATKELEEIWRPTERPSLSKYNQGFSSHNSLCASSFTQNVTPRISLLSGHRQAIVKTFHDSRAIIWNGLCMSYVLTSVGDGRSWVGLPVSGGTAKALLGKHTPLNSYLIYNNKRKVIPVIAKKCVEGSGGIAPSI
jgi:hypothetical protein